jgi:hypothetical protein
MGVLSIFDDIEIPLRNLLNFTKKGGRIFIHGMFNPFPVDVFIKYSESGSSIQKDFLESGWNIISQQTISNILLKYGVKNIIFHEFKINIDILKQSDPLRSWTELLSNGDRQIINGLCIKQPQYILEIEK